MQNIKICVKNIFRHIGRLAFMCLLVTPAERLEFFLFFEFFHLGIKDGLSIGGRLGHRFSEPVSCFGLSLSYAAEIDHFEFEFYMTV